MATTIAAAHFCKKALGFQSRADAGPETGTKDRASYVIQQNKLTFVLVKVIASKVEDGT